MINKIKEIFFLLEKKQQKKIIYLQILILLTACMEVLSLFAIAPFMSILADYEVINKEIEYVEKCADILENNNAPSLASVPQGAETLPYLNRNLKK